MLQVVFLISLCCAADAGKYRDSGFNWLDRGNWEWADGSPMHDARQLFHSDHIVVDRKVRRTPFRTRQGWTGRKVVYAEWIASEDSDTNIWMLNTKIHPQFAANNGWPYFGELDLFEMFTANQKKFPHYDYSGFREFHDVASYGQMTFHFGGKHNDVYRPCFCPASHSKKFWYQNKRPMTGGCTAQFANKPRELNRLAAVFEENHEGGHYIQLIQNPKLVESRHDGTWDIEIDEHSSATSRILNNREFFWGIPAGQCNNGDHNPDTGFPFMEEF